MTNNPTLIAPLRLLSSSAVGSADSTNWPQTNLVANAAWQMECPQPNSLTGLALDSWVTNQQIS